MSKTIDALGTKVIQWFEAFPGEMEGYDYSESKIQFYASQFFGKGKIIMISEDELAEAMDTYRKEGIKEALDRIEEANVPAPCEPDCDAVRHALHQGGWNHSLEIDKEIQAIRGEL